MSFLWLSERELLKHFYLEDLWLYMKEVDPIVVYDSIQQHHDDD